MEELFKTKCKEFLEKKDKFEWFIKTYFGNDAVDKLVKLAQEDKGGELLKELNWIWFTLPDSKFNIIENPPGWSEFLSVIEY